jgi:hypothetical protein
MKNFFLFLDKNKQPRYEVAYVNLEDKKSFLKRIRSHSWKIVKVFQEFNPVKIIYKLPP